MADAPTKSIICADDEEAIRKILTRILQSRGYNVRACANGAEVLDMYLEQPADLVLLDVSMPVMSGIEACKELRKRPESYDVPIIMVSGIGSEEIITQGLSCGADDYILKPFQTEEILAKVSMALRKRAANQATDLGMAIGSRFVGRYDIKKKITSGGFSTIFLATDVSSDPLLDVALKIFDLPVSKRSDSRFISLFLREAYQLAKLDHPHIVKLHEFGQTGHFYFLALEFLKGESVDQRVARDGPMEWQEVVKIGYEVALALQYLQDHRMVHRDVKPANIFLTEAGASKLVDFGLAKQQDEATLSIGDEFRGTPAFVSPEYILGDTEVDIRSDVYSLGISLYYAITSVILFAGKNAMEILNKHFQVVPPSVQQFDPTISEEFSNLIDDMLIKERDQRPGIDEVVDVFEDVLAQMRGASTTKRLKFKLKLKESRGSAQQDSDGGDDQDLTGTKSRLKIKTPAEPMEEEPGELKPIFKLKARPKTPDEDQNKPRDEASRSSGLKLKRIDPPDDDAGPVIEAREAKDDEPDQPVFKLKNRPRIRLPEKPPEDDETDPTKTPVLKRKPPQDDN